jgi:hypothetical protein
VSFSDLRSDATVHSITIDLVQTALKRDEFGMALSEEEGGQISIDQWRVVDTGTIKRMIPSVNRPKEGEYLWRGEAARKHDPESARRRSKARERARRESATLRRPTSETIAMSSSIDGQNATILDESSLHLRPVFTLPTPINGAVPSTRVDHDLSPTFHPSEVDLRRATLSHRLEVTIAFSVLNENAVGEALAATRSQKEPLEGTVRHVVIPANIELSSCLSRYTASPPPPYRRESQSKAQAAVKSSASQSRSTSNFLRYRPFDTLPEKLKTIIKLEHMRSLSAAGGRWLRPVRWNEGLLTERTDIHRRDTGGMCLCFVEDDLSVGAANDDPQEGGQGQTGSKCK